MFFVEPITVDEALLKRLFYFHQLQHDQLQQVAKFASIHRFQANTHVFSEGDYAKRFYIVLKGHVKIYKLSKEGKEMVLHLFGPTDLFAEVPIFSGIPKYPANALCLEDSVLLGIEGEPFVHLARAFPDIGLNMLVVMAKRLHEFNQLIEDLSLRGVDSRLAKYLVLTSQMTGVARLTIPKKMLASVLGTIPETLSRALSKLAKEGLIALEGNDIQVLKHQALVQLADLLVD